MEVITVFDRLRIYDDQNISRINRKKNFARIILDGELIDETNNMVVMPGQAMTIQRLFNKIPSGQPDYTNYIISHFGIGSGGSTVTGGIAVLNGPDICDKDTYSPIQINPGNSLFLTSPSGTDYAAKPIEQDGSFEFLVNSDYDCSPDVYYTIMKCNCVINRNEPTNLNPGDSIKVDEAALYAVNPSSGDTLTYAKICFAPKYIEQSTEFIIEWYIIC